MYASSSPQAFNLFDGDGNGIITLEEFRKLLEKVGGAVTMSDDEAEALFAEVTSKIQLNAANPLKADEDGNQVLDYAEFARVWDAMRGSAEVCWVQRCSLS